MSQPTTNPIRVVNFSVTHRCNCACACCYQKKDPQELPAIAIAAIISRLGAFGVHTLMIGGGEPLLRPDLPAIVAQAARLGMETYVGSNGLLLDAATAEDLHRAGLSLFFLGLDDPLAPGNKDSDPQRARAIVGLLRQAGLVIVVNLIITRAVAARFEDTLHCLKAMGVDHVNLLRPRPDAGGNWFPSARLGPTELACLHAQLLGLGPRLGMRLSLDCAFGPLIHGHHEPGYFVTRQIVTCSAGVTYCHLNPAGQVFPCPYLALPEYSLGHIMAEDFPDRWKSGAVFHLLRDRDKFAAPCGHCAYRWDCGGCRALSLHDGAGLTGGDPDCPFER